MLDIAIIGSGPAALSAALNCVQRNKTVKIFGRSVDSSLLFAAEKVDNYLGMPDINGEELLNRFYNHAIKQGVEFQECKVTQILNMGDYYTLNAENQFINAKSIIIASGIIKSKALLGELEFLGKGVSYCATCDGMLYKNKTVVVIAENGEGEADANFLSDICKKVIYVPLYEPVYYIKSNIDIKIGNPEKIIGENHVKSIIINGESINCDGIFLIKNTVPPESLLFGLETEKNSIKVNRNMETNLKRVYAAGDCTGAPYQIAKAVGEGLIAALSAASELDKH